MSTALTNDYLIDSRLMLLALLVVGAAIIDISCRRIPNWLILIGLISSLGAQWFDAQGHGLIAWLSGSGMGLLLFLPLYLMGAMGAGDVKLMAAVGSFIGGAGALTAAMLTLIAGGVLGLLWAMLSGKLSNLWQNLRYIASNIALAVLRREMPRADFAVQSAGSLPYAVAIAAGTLLHLYALRLGTWPALS